MSVITASPAARDVAIGVGALVATIVLWSAFALSTRALGETTLTTIDAALLRFATPMLLLSPWLPRMMRSVRRAPRGAVLMILCAGLPHFLVFTWGAELTSAGMTGLLVPGSVPVLVALLLLARTRRPPSRRRSIALALIVAGVVASAAIAGPGSDPFGIAVLLAAGLAWATYTVGLRDARLDPVSVILLISTTSTIAAGAIAVGGIAPSHILDGAVDVGDAAGFALVQGIGTGVLSTVCYVVAVARLGSGAAASAGASSPVLTAIAATVLLGEPITLALAVALGLIVTGVVLHSRAELRPARRARTEEGGRRVQRLELLARRPYPVQTVADTS